MKKAKRLLAIVLAFVMVLSVSSTAFAKNELSDYEVYKSTPYTYSPGLNSIEKFNFSYEQGCAYILDLLDGLLSDGGIVMRDELVVNESMARIGLTIYIDSVDGLLWTLYNLGKGLKGDSDCLKNIVTTGEVGLSGAPISIRGVASKLLEWISLGDLDNGLDTSAIGNQNAVSGVKRRGVPATAYYLGNQHVVGTTDTVVFESLLNFLSDNRAIFKKVGNSTVDLGLLDGIIKDAIKDKFDLGDVAGSIKNLLYPLLWNSEADAAPANFSYDSGIQQIINWLLIDGTGTSPDTGANSVFGPEYEPFLPGIKDYPGAADISTISFYQLINNAIRALLGGMVGDLLVDALVDACDVDVDANDGKGDEAAMSNTIMGVVDAAIDYFLQAGAPPITFTEEEEIYPVPHIQKAINWLLGGGGLDTFIHISIDGISITDNFMNLLARLIRLVPGLLTGLLEIQVPEGLLYTEDELNALASDPEYGQIYLTYEGEEIYLEEGSTDYYYLSDGTYVNTTDPSREDTYRNPTFILEKHVIPDDAIYGNLVKVLLYSLVDGCYFPTWADSIASVGAYALASIAAQYVPENKYFDRLDKYHFESINEAVPSYIDSTVDALPYTEALTINGNSVEVPRAAMDIGASIASFLLNAAFDFKSGLGYWLETDNSFEDFFLEFLMWACGTFLPVLSGTMVTNEDGFPTYNALGNNRDGYAIRSAFNQALNSAASAANILNTRYNNDQNTRNGTKCNIPGSELAPIVYNLIDNTIFKLIPLNWLPAWVEQGGSAALFNDWLLNGVMTFDLQKIISLLSANHNGELENNTKTVLLRLIDRIFALLFGKNAILYPANTTVNNRDAFVEPTQVDSFDKLLDNVKPFDANNSSLAALLECLLYRLAEYGPSLGGTTFPLLMSILVKPIKSAAYTDKNGIERNYIGSHQITRNELQAYYDSYQTDTNAVAFSGQVLFSSSLKAEQVALDIGLGEITVTDIGSNDYPVNFPETYNKLSQANLAVKYLGESKTFATSDDTFYVSNKQTSEGRIIKVMRKLDYKNATATRTVTEYNAAGDVITASSADKVAVQRLYEYNNFTRAHANSVNGSYRTGTYGEVVYGSGFKTLEREDFPTQKVYYKNRLNNAIEDCESFMKNYDSFISSELPSAYGSWMIFWIKMQLKANNKYDKNDDGVINADDTYPSQPSENTVYPFSGSGSTRRVNNVIDKTYAFNTAASSQVVADALAWAAENDYDENNNTISRDVKLSITDTETVVRWALNDNNFDITADGDGNYHPGSFGFEGITAANGKLTTLNNRLDTIGWRYDETDHAIYRPAFALITTSLLGASFGSNGNVTVPVTPPTAYNKDADGALNDLQESFIEFAEAIDEYEDGLNDYYDNISWRAEICESSVIEVPRLETLKFILRYTSAAYAPAGLSNGRNRRYNEEGNLQAAYTSGSFDAFQKAYDYGQSLVNYVEADGTAAQSLVTSAYKAILENYKNLVVFEGAASWTALLNYINQANDILDGPLGLGEGKDRDNGYTVETLTALAAQVAEAEALYNSNSQTFDTESQPIVDQAATDLFTIIGRLAFPPGVSPHIELTDEDGDININEYSIGSSSRTFGIITGLQEKIGFREQDKETYFYTAGYTRDDNIGNRYVYGESGRGTGTGSYVVGQINFTEQFRYYAVLFGDLNGDARIDTTDANIVGMLSNTKAKDDIDKYLFIAGDVNQDGALDEADYRMILAYAHHTVDYSDPNMPEDKKILQSRQVAAENLQNS